MDMENRRRSSSRGAGLAWLWVLLLCAGIGCFLFFTPPGQRIARAILRRAGGGEPVRTKIETKIVEKERVVEKKVEVPVPAPPPALPSGPSLGTRGDMTTMFSGIQLKSTLIPSPGDTATLERATPASYSVDLTVRIKIPKPASTLEQLRPLNPQIANILPGLPELLANGKVSGFFHHLYDLKQKHLQQNILRLDRALSRHNFYDLETLLELQHPATKRKVLLMQAEMDVVSDGSDGDRMASFDDYIFKSQHFQPTTSYGWPKLTSRPNPLVAKLEEELRGIREKLKNPNLGRTEKTNLESRAASIPRIVDDLKKRSYLIAQEDPFIVIPMSMRGYKERNAWTPSIGDYAVVIAGNKVMPAIVGDYGPSVKVGEASLRIARELDPTAGPYKRPISDLKVTYLIFPDSADPVKRQPDYAAWHAKCAALLEDIGGLGSGVRLHEWEDRLKAAATPVTTTGPGATENAGDGAARETPKPAEDAAAPGASSAK